jgi:hypothetical protein
MRKRIYLFLSALLLSFSWVWSQNVPLFGDDIVAATKLTNWTSLSVSGNPWTYNVNARQGAVGSATCFTHPDQANDSWLFSPGVVLKKDVTYTISYRSRRMDGQFDVKIGTSATPAGQTNALGSILTGSSWALKTVTYTPTETNTYYLGFRCVSAANTAAVDPVSIDENTSHASTKYIAFDEVKIEGPTDWNATLVSIDAPAVSGINLSATEQVKITVKNSGAETIEDLSVKFDLGSSVGYGFGTIQGQILSGETKNYTFPQTVDLSQDGAYTIKAYAELPGEEFPADNEKTINITNTVCAGITAPWSESFSSSTFPPSVCWARTSATNNHWSRVTVGVYPTCSPYDSDGGMIMYNNYGLPSGRSGVLTLPVLNIPAASNPVNFSFWMYRDKDGSYGSGNDLVNIYLSPTSDKADGTLAYTVHRNRDLEPVVATTGWYQYKVVVPVDGAPKQVYIHIEGVSSYNNNTFVDKFEILTVNEYDAGVIAITSPVSGINKTNAEAVTIKVKNYGTQPLTSIPVKFEVGGVVVGNETITILGGLAPDGEYEYTFQNATADLHETNTYEIKAYTVLANDGNATNDAKSVSVTNTICADLPATWTQSFDAALDACWESTTTGTVTNINHFWQIKTGATTTPDVTPFAGAGRLYFNCDLTPVGSIARVVSPQFTTIENSELSFYIYRHGASNWADIVNFYLLTTGGESKIFSVYENMTKTTDFAGTESVAGWYQYRVLIPASTTAQLVIEGVSDGGYCINIDELKVAPISKDAGVTAIITPSSGTKTNLPNENTVTVKVKNYGLTTLDNVVVKYEVNDVVIGSGSLGSLAANTEVEYTFAQLADFSEEKEYAIEAYTSVENDANLLNDTAKVNFTNTVCSVISTYPLEQKFTQNTLSPCYERTSGQINEVLGRDGDGDYCWFFSAAGYLVTPELVATTAAKTVEFYYQRRYINATEIKVGYSETTSANFIWETIALEELSGTEDPAYRTYIPFKTIVPGAAKYVAIQWVSGSSIVVDDIKIDVVRNIDATNPVDGATDVSITQDISATFNQDITLVNGGAGITVKAGDDAFGIAVSSDGKILNIKHEPSNTPFAYNTVYTVTIPAGSIEGLVADMVWSFTTEAAPAPVKFTPNKGQTNVQVGQTVEIQFDKSIAGSSLEGITINEEPITPELQEGNIDATETVSGYSVPSSRLVLRPALDYGTAYTVYIPASAIKGLTADIDDWTFTTEERVAIASKTPADGAQGVALDAEVAITFNKNITLWSAGLGVPKPPRPEVQITDQNGNTITADFKAGGGFGSINKVIITRKVAPTEPEPSLTLPLLPGKRYTVSVPADVVPAYKAQVSTEPITWSFKTEDIKVINATPGDWATDIALDAAVSVTFDKAVNTYGEPDLTLVKILNPYGDEVTGVAATYEGAVINITHDAFDEGLEYQVVIPVEAVQGLYSAPDIYFTTYETPLAAVTYTPEVGTQNAELDTEISVEFNKNIFLRVNTGIGTPSKVTINGVVVTTSLTPPTNKLIINHAELEYNTEYEVVIEARYLQKQTAAIRWTFKTKQDVGISTPSTGSVYAANQKLHVSDYELGTSVSVYTVAGNLLTSQKVVDKDLVIDLAQGAYIVNIQSERQTTIHKVLVK